MSARNRRRRDMFEAERLAAKEQANYNKRTIGRCPRRKIKHRTAQDATNHTRARSATPA